MGKFLNDKVVVVTGASSGIGEAMAREYSKMGAKVVMAARREDELKRIASEIEAQDQLFPHHWHRRPALPDCRL